MQRAQMQSILKSMETNVKDLQMLFTKSHQAFDNGNKKLTYPQLVTLRAAAYYNEEYFKTELELLKNTGNETDNQICRESYQAKIKNSQELRKKFGL